MMVIRPAEYTDLEQLQQIAIEAGIGMTTLPKQPELLQEKLRLSIDSFARVVEEPGRETYFLVMEDTLTGRVVGSCAVMAAVGLTRPFYSFRVIRLTHTSQELHRYEPVEALQMVDEYRGSTEIATLYLTPDARKDRNGRLLSRCRFLLLAEFPERFARLVIAEMRGVQGENGHAIFWNAVGRQFIHMDFSKADYLSSLGQHQFIADLMPKHPVYVRLLPKEVQDVIGATHEATRPALELLKREGFRWEGCVDVFDAGPAVHCPLDQIRTVRESRRALLGAVLESLETATFMIATTTLEGYRVVRGSLREVDGCIEIGRETAEALGVGVGDALRYVEF